MTKKNSREKHPKVRDNEERNQKLKRRRAKNELIERNDKDDEPNEAMNHDDALNPQNEEDLHANEWDDREVTKVETNNEDQNNKETHKKGTQPSREDNKQRKEDTHKTSTQPEEMAKGKAAMKELQPIALPVVPSLDVPENKRWAGQVGFKTLLRQDWEALAQSEGAEELIKGFVETDVVVVPGKMPVPLTTQLLNQVLGLHDEGNTEPT